jgi:hypothetical protein
MSSQFRYVGSRLRYIARAAPVEGLYRDFAIRERDGHFIQRLFESYRIATDTVSLHTEHCAVMSWQKSHNTLCVSPRPNQTIDQMMRH